MTSTAEVNPWLMRACGVLLMSGVAAAVAVPLEGVEAYLRGVGLFVIFGAWFGALIFGAFLLAWPRREFPPRTHGACAGCKGTGYAWNSKVCQGCAAGIGRRPDAYDVADAKLEATELREEHNQ